MKDSESQHLVEHGPALLLKVRCTETLVAHLKKKILGQDDAEKILSFVRRELNTEAVAKLLEVLPSRTGGYEEFLLALEKTQQTDAVAILRLLSGYEATDGAPSSSSPSVGTPLDLRPTSLIISYEHLDKLRNIVAEDPSAIDNWSAVIPSLVTAPGSKFKLRRQLNNDPVETVIYDTLQVFVGESSDPPTLALLLEKLEARSLGRLAVQLKNRRGEIWT